LILRVRVVFCVAFALVASVAFARVAFARVAIALQVLTRQSVQLDAMHCCTYRGAWRASTLSSAPERFSASPWLKRQLQRHWASHLCTDQVAAFSLLLRLLPLLEELPARHKESRVPFATLKVDKQIFDDHVRAWECEPFPSNFVFIWSNFCWSVSSSEMNSACITAAASLAEACCSVEFVFRRNRGPGAAVANGGMGRILGD